jgi:hypothetical protein
MYQGLSLGWSFGVTVARPLLATALPESHWLELNSGGPVSWATAIFDPLEHLRELVHDFGWPMAFLFLPLALLLFRLVLGLARLAHDEPPVPARLRTAWREGRGEAGSALGLWTQVLLMMFLAALIFLGSTQLFSGLLRLGEHHPLRILLFGLSLGLVGIYGFVLSVLFQLALHSLAQNRRGVGSALLHAWRILRADPFAAGRATIVDAVLYVTVLGLQLAALFVVFGVFHPLLEMARHTGQSTKSPGLNPTESHQPLKAQWPTLVQMLDRQ